MKSVRRYILAAVLLCSGQAFGESLEQCLLDELPQMKDASQARPIYQYCDSKFKRYEGAKKSGGFFGYADAWQCIVDNRRLVIGESAKRYIVRACNALYVPAKA